MAAVTRAVVRKDEDNRMTNKTNNRLTPVAHQPGRLPARTYMSILARFRGGGGSEHRVAALATAAARMLRAYSVQVETLCRHVHVNDGGQAVIGNVKAAGSGAAGSPEHSARELIAPAPSGHRD